MVHDSSRGVYERHIRESVTPENSVQDKIPSIFDNHAIKNRRSIYRPSNDHHYCLRKRRAPTYLAQSATNYKHMAVNFLAAREAILPKLQHIYNMHGKRQSLETLLNGIDKKVWI